MASRSTRSCASTCPASRASGVRVARCGPMISRVRRSHDPRGNRGTRGRAAFAKGRNSEPLVAHGRSEAPMHEMRARSTSVIPRLQCSSHQAGRVPSRSRGLPRSGNRPRPKSPPSGEAAFPRSVRERASGEGGREDGCVQNGEDATDCGSAQAPRGGHGGTPASTHADARFTPPTNEASWP